MLLPTSQLDCAVLNLSTPDIEAPEVIARAQKLCAGSLDERF